RRSGRPRRLAVVGHAYRAGPHARARLEGKRGAATETVATAGFRLAPDQHGDRTPAQRRGAAVLRRRWITGKADGAADPRTLAGRRAFDHGRFAVAALICQLCKISSPVVPA